MRFVVGITDNNMEDHDELSVHPIVSWLRTIIIFAVSFLVISSNLINLIVLRRTTEIPSNSRFCLMNLSCADLLLGCVSCAPCVVISATDRWIYGDIWCQISGIVYGTSATVSVWSLALISVDRYLAIVYPLRYHNLMTTKRCHIVVGCFWLISALTFLFPLTIKANFLYYQFDSAQSMCGFYWEYPWFCVATAICIPVLSGLVLGGTNYWTIRAVGKMNGQIAPRNVEPSSSVASENDKRSNIYVSEHRTIVTSIKLDVIYDGQVLGRLERDDTLRQDNENPSTSNVPTSHDKRNRTKDERRLPSGKDKTPDVKVLKVLVVTSVTYFVAWGPYVTIAFITSLFPDTVPPIWLEFLVTWLGNSNSFMNVIIYSLMYSSFRKKASYLITKYFSWKCWRKNNQLRPSL